MGKADTVTKEYMQDAEVFADAFNYYIYGGKQVIRPEQLRALDTTELATLFGENSENAQVQVYRDVLKSVTAMEDGRFAYLILGIENQTSIHYAMPVRNMMYDALQYYSQVKAIVKKNRNEHTARSKDEYLSGFSGSDRLLPVITLVVYFGAKAWDAPKSLHEMLAIEDAAALRYVADYRINLLEPATMTDADIAKLQTDLKDVFYFIKYSRDKEKLQELIENNEDFHRMKKSTAEVIRTVADADIDFPEGEERIDMCLAIEQMRKESEAIGLAKGKSEGKLEGRLEGRLEGKLNTLFELVKCGFLTVRQAASNAGLSEDRFTAEMTKAGF